MVRVIAQETFDAVVKENMADFDMNKEEAIKEAKEQFESQGVDLTNVVMGMEEDSVILKSLKSLENLTISDDNSTNFVYHCNLIDEECKKGLAEKVLCTNHKGYEILVECAKKSGDHENVQASAVRALATLLDKNPDTFDTNGFSIVINGLQKAKGKKLVEATLDLVLSCCVLHEMNRQNLVRNGLLDRLDEVVNDHPVGVARVWQALVQDDDVRVPHGKAHENARSIVEDHDGLPKLATAVRANFEIPSNLKLLLSCLSSLSVRNEYCEQVVKEHDILKSILDLLLEPTKQPKGVVMESLRLLKTLAGNDNVKKDIATSQGIPIINNAILSYMSSGAICHAGCSAITAICLRMPDNAKQVMDAGGAELLTQILKTHLSSSSNVSIACSNAIRNIVSRSRQFSADFIALDVENLLHEVRKNHARSDENVKAALRDLGLKVEFKEEWKGTGVTVSNDSTSTIKELPEDI